MNKQSSEESQIIEDFLKALRDQARGVPTHTEEEHLYRIRTIHQTKSELVAPFMGLTFHWFFWVAVDCFAGSESVLAASVCLVNGIEASIRAVEAVEKNYDLDTEMHRTKSLSNAQLRKLRDYGIDISVFSFSDEADFNSNIEKNDGQSQVKLVALRNAINHGNLTGYIVAPEELQGDKIFVPNFLEQDFKDLFLISHRWGKEYSSWKGRK